ncbi:MAG: DUF2141 domain-containing protein [Planctomycetota bacterium]
MDTDHNSTMEKRTSNTQVGTVIDGHVDADAPVNLWRENHGNLYILATVLILAVGAMILAYQQMRFRPPEFPSGSAFPRVLADTGGEVETEEPVADTANEPESRDAATSESAGREEPGADAVVIEVVGAGEPTGVVRIAVYTDAEGFNRVDQAFLKNAIVVDGSGSATWAVPREKLLSRFAVAAYHDRNEDAELNRNVLGIPTERYGFSNDARGRLGPPSFDQAAMRLPEAGQKIPISIR